MENKEEIPKSIEIKLLQYKSFRRCFNENLLIPILGKDYYNMGASIYTADEYTTQDLKSKFDSMKNDIKMYKNIFRIYTFILISLIIFLIVII